MTRKGSHRRGGVERDSGLKNSSSWRLFCAIELPVELRGELEHYSQELQRRFDDVATSWTKPGNMHLTLKFFGNVDQSKVESLSAVLDRVAVSVTQFPIGVGTTGTFPVRGAPSVLWIGISDPSSQLMALHSAIEQQCEQAGFEPEGRDFNPHLTIARVRDARGARELGQTHLQNEFFQREFEASEVVLFKSDLSSKGARYTVVSRHSFGSAAHADDR